MPPVRATVLSWLALFGSGCGGDTGTEGLEVGRVPHECIPHEIELSSESAEIPFDAPLRELLTPTRGEQAMTLYYISSWDDDPNTTAVEAVAEVIVSRARPYKPYGLPAQEYDPPYELCPDSIEADGVLRLESSDGAFRERIPGTLVLSPRHQATFEGRLPLAQKRGSYPSPGDATDRVLRVAVHQFPGGSHDAASGGGAGPRWSGTLSIVRIVQGQQVGPDQAVGSWWADDPVGGREVEP